MITNIVLAIMLVTSRKYHFLFSIYLFIYLFIFYCCSGTVVSISPLPHSPPPTLDPTPFAFVHVSFIYVPCWSFPLSPTNPLFPSFLVTVSLFFVSISLVIL